VLNADSRLPRRGRLASERDRISTCAQTGLRQSAVVMQIETIHLRIFQSCLNSLPGLRIRYAKAAPGLAEEFFETRPLLDEMAKTAICQ